MNIGIQYLVWGTVIVADLALAVQIWNLRKDLMTVRNDLGAIMKSGIVINILLAFLQSAANRRNQRPNDNR